MNDEAIDAKYYECVPCKVGREAGPIHCPVAHQIEPGKEMYIPLCILSESIFSRYDFRILYILSEFFFFLILCSSGAG
jgi:hypothetical protein